MPTIMGHIQYWVWVQPETIRKPYGNSQMPETLTLSGSDTGCCCALVGEPSEEEFVTASRQAWSQNRWLQVQMEASIVLGTN